jgi:hypothetical protein
VALIVLAFTFRTRTRTRPRPLTGRTPRPWLVAATAFAASTLYWVRDTLLPAGTPDWIAVTGWFLLAGAVLALCTRWSRTPAWGPAHRLALASGALLTYTWLGFTQSRDLAVPHPTALLGNVVFTLAALGLLALAARSLRQRGPYAGPARPRDLRP